MFADRAQLLLEVMEVTCLPGHGFSSCNESK